MRIKFFSSFCDSNECKAKYERLCEVAKMSNYKDTINNNIFITTKDDYTHAIILNTAMPVLKIPKENVIGLAFEPPPYLKLTVEFIHYAQKYIGKYFIGDKQQVCLWSGQSTCYWTALPDVFREHYAYIWHNTPLNYIPVKNKLMSIMVSDKRFAPGHKYRHALVEHILSTNLPIDIYGTGVSKYGGRLMSKKSMFYKESLQNREDARLKGKFNELEPYETYHFHICIENFQTNAYFSEKITNTLLCATTPIYLGCRNILTFFPENVIVLSGNIHKDMLLLRDILLNPNKYKATINVNAIKDKLSLLKNVEELFSSPYPPPHS